MLENITGIFVKSKKYWIAYLIFITITCLSTVTAKNFVRPQFVIATFIIVAVLGVLCIVFYFMHDSESELYKVAFVIILCFGVLSALIVPIADVSDELEHITRAEITSQGVMFPHWEGGEHDIDRLYNHTNQGRYSSALNKDVGFNTTKDHTFFLNNLGKTVFQTPNDTKKISNETMLDGSAFEQNPFYGYLPQAVGVFLAKFFNMNVIWMMWLGRIFNLICYAGLISLAIKKTPALKIPLLVVACIPLSIYQGASVSIDSMIIGLGILTIAYFIYMYKAEPGSISAKHVAVFCALSLLLGLCKLPYLAFVFLILLVPKPNFKNKKMLWYVLLGILIVGIIGVLWSTYSEPSLMHSWRSKLNLMSASLQMNYLMNHPMGIVRFFRLIFTFTLGLTANGLFNFFAAGSPNHYSDHYTLITVLLWIFLIITLWFYPRRPDFDFRARWGSLSIMLIVYVGICFVQLLTWADVGAVNIGVSARYFLPLLALFPIIIPYKFDQLEWFADKHAIVLIVGFMATLILAFATKYYY